MPASAQLTAALSTRLMVLPTAVGRYLINIVKPYGYGPESGPAGRLFDRPSYFKFVWQKRILANEQYFLLVTADLTRKRP